MLNRYRIILEKYLAEQDITQEPDDNTNSLPVRLSGVLSQVKKQPGSIKQPPQTDPEAKIVKDIDALRNRFASKPIGKGGNASAGSAKENPQGDISGSAAKQPRQIAPKHPVTRKR